MGGWVQWGVQSRQFATFRATASYHLTTSRCRCCCAAAKAPAFERAHLLHLPTPHTTRPCSPCSALLDINGQIFQEQARALNEVASRDCKVRGTLDHSGNAAADGIGTIWRLWLQHAVQVWPLTPNAAAAARRCWWWATPATPTHSSVRGAAARHGCPCSASARAFQTCGLLLHSCRPPLTAAIYPTLLAPAGIHNAPDLPARNWHALTRLDENRAKVRVGVGVRCVRQKQLVQRRQAACLQGAELALPVSASPPTLVLCRLLLLPPAVPAGHQGGQVLHQRDQRGHLGQPLHHPGGGGWGDLGAPCRVLLLQLAAAVGCLAGLV